LQDYIIVDKDDVPTILPKVKEQDIKKAAKRKIYLSNWYTTHESKNSARNSAKKESVKKESVTKESVNKESNKEN
jgi:hypothetical protein